MATHMESQVENDRMENGFVRTSGHPKDPSIHIHILFTFGPKVYKHCLHWAFWSPRVRLVHQGWIRFEVRSQKVQSEILGLLPEIMG